jgi:hypothetical protein
MRLKQKGAWAGSRPERLPKRNWSAQDIGNYLGRGFFLSLQFVDKMVLRFLKPQGHFGF